DASTGTITGRTAMMGRHAVVLEVADGQGNAARRRLVLEVMGRASSDDDEGAEAPARDERSELNSRTRLLPTAAGMLDGARSMRLAATGDVSDLLSILSTMRAGNWAVVNLNRFADVWTP